MTARSAVFPAYPRQRIRMTTRIGNWLLGGNAALVFGFLYLPVLILMVEREGRCFLLPDEGFGLKQGDALLIAGQHSARFALYLTLQNANALDYLLTGKDKRGGWVWQMLFSR